MRRDIQIVGIGRRKKGNGNRGPYDFTDVCIMYDEPSISGKRAELITIDQTMLDEHPIEVGAVYDCEVCIFNFKSKILCFYA